MLEDDEMPSEAAVEAAVEPEEEVDFDTAFEEFASDDANPDDTDNAMVEDDIPVVDDVEEEVKEVEKEPDEVEKLQQQLNDLNHKYKSNDGRVAAYQRQIEQLQGQLSAGKADNANGDDDDQEGESSALQTAKEEYPEIFAPLEKKWAKDEKRIEALEFELAAARTEKRQDQLGKQETILSDAHSDWEQVTELPEFSQWIRNQPQYVQEAAMRNGDVITNGQEAIDLIDRFKSTNLQNEPSGDVPDTPKPLAGKRRRQLESAASVGSKGTGAASGPPEDFDAAFKYYSSKK